MICDTQTDKVKKVQLPSSIKQVVWTRRMAAVGGTVGLQVFTQFVGNGSELKIELTDKSGKTFGIFSDKISGNKLWVEIAVPGGAKEGLCANVKLPKHGLQMKSALLLLVPPIQITNAKWDKKEARRGDVLKLAAHVSGVPDGVEATIEILERDGDGAHDLITKFPVLVKNSKIEAEWEFEYHEDTDKIPTEEEVKKYGNHYNPPEYFFRVKVGGLKAESGLLGFRDWIEIVVMNLAGDPIPNKKYVLHFPDGSKRKGTIGPEGTAKEEDIPPGRFNLEFEGF